MWWDAESWLIALPKTSRKRSSNRRWTNEEGEARSRLVLKLVVSVGLLAYFLARIHIERFLQTFAIGEIFLYRFGDAGLSFYPRHQRGALDDSGPTAWHQDAVYSHAALLFDRHVL